jgi:hypothetical protein
MSEWANALSNELCNAPGAISRADTAPCSTKKIEVDLMEQRTKGRKAKTRQRAVDEELEQELLRLISDLDSPDRRQLSPDGEQGYLLAANELELLQRWALQVQSRRRGRPSKAGHPTQRTLFNLYTEEFERERKKAIQARGGKERGAIKKAITILAKRHRVEFDAMRKRIKGN